MVLSDPSLVSKSFTWYTHTSMKQSFSVVQPRSQLSWGRTGASPECKRAIPDLRLPYHRVVIDPWQWQLDGPGMLHCIVEVQLLLTDTL